ncbi:TRAP transporter small permease [Azospirillum doebereinerae]|uniref:TRAP transporter small permease protein n=1 Tax=Azospirillum doebereinerae TaxID=92933 RepID=A0A433JD01_9PROT|nr:TRAP transporter small permease [Azospirillum doebereinerae]MCG5238478.1 TRAP transporter small permease [Azospirillum doebereinerae]RUQ74559.1 TRAP transporter small permease [Azospirillum doebereinerae]
MKTLVDGYFHVLKALIAACLAGMVVLVFGNVLLRYGFNSGITVSEELSRLFFVWLTFLGAIVGLHERAHLGVDTLVMRLPRSGKTACVALSYALMLYVTVLMLQGSWTQTIINLEVRAPATGLSMAWLYGVGVIFSLSTGAILLHELYRVLTGKATEDELVMVTESEELPEAAAHHDGPGGHRHGLSPAPANTTPIRTASSR